MILSLEKLIYVLTFFIVSLLSGKGKSFSKTSVVDNTLWSAMNVDKVTHLIDLKTLPFPNLNKFLLFSSLPDCWSSFLDTQSSGAPQYNNCHT